MADTTTIRISKNLADDIKIFAEAENKSMNQFADELLINAFTHYFEEITEGMEKEEPTLREPKHRSDDGVLLTVAQAAKVFNLGLSSVRSEAKKCGAELKIGRCIRIDREKFLEHLRTLNK